MWPATGSPVSPTVLAHAGPCGQPPVLGRSRHAELPVHPHVGGQGAGVGGTGAVVAGGGLLLHKMERRLPAPLSPARWGGGRHPAVLRPGHSGPSRPTAPSSVAVLTR